MTADEDTLKKLPIGGILKASWQYFCDNGKMMLAFTLINFATLVSGVYSWKTAFSGWWQRLHMCSGVIFSVFILIVVRIWSGSRLCLP